MSSNIDTRRQNYESVQLEILELRKLTDSEWQAVNCCRLDPHGQVFSVAFPIVVATFKRAKYEEIHKWAQKRRKTYPVYRKDTFLANAVVKRHEPLFNYPFNFIQRTTTAFHRDIQKIHNALYGFPDLGKGVYQIGHFKEQRIRNVHVDASADVTAIPSIIYVARVGALPIEVISGVRLSTTTKDERSLIQRSMKKNGTTATEELRRRKVLEPIALGNVIMMLGAAAEFGGTHHCSSVVPPKGTGSAFFAEIGKLQHS